MKLLPDAQEPPRPQRLTDDEQAQITACLAVLEDLTGLQGHLLANGPDPGVELRLEGGRPAEFVVELVGGTRLAQLGPFAHRARDLEGQGKRLLLCAKRVPDALGAELRAHGIHYMDAGGNAWVRAPEVFVLITGRRPVEQPWQVRHLRGSEVRLLGVFLMDPGAGKATQAELAERAGIAIGAIGGAREALAGAGILEATDKRYWRVRDRLEGLRRFAEGWAARVRPKLHPRKYRLLPAGQGPLEQRFALLAPALGGLLGGELAAAYLTKYIETEHATLHVIPGHRNQVAQTLALVPDDAGPVTVLDRYGTDDAYTAPTFQVLGLAHPLLIWAECLTTPDERVAQTAARVYEEWLLRPHV